MTGGVVDAHHHLWDPRRRSYAFLDAPEYAPIRRPFGPADLTAAATRHGVAQTVVVQAAPEVAETAELLGLAADSPVVGAVVGWVDLDGGAAVADAQLSRLRAQPGGRLLAGVRAMAQDHPDPEWLAGDRVAAAVAAVGQAEMVCDLLITPRELTAAATLVARSPEVVFVIDHAAKPPIATGDLEPWAAGLRALAELPNTVCKISGLVTEAAWDSWTVAEIAPYVDVAAQAFGPDRLLFGSDWPVCLLAAAYEDVIGLARETLAGQPADAVFAATARRVYGLEAAE